MNRAASILFVSATMWAVPRVAYSAGGTSAVSVSEIAGAAALAAAVVLLVAATGLQRVARGSAIADNISYVVGACICLGAVALGRWVERLVGQGITGEQIALSSDVLTLAAIILFSVYFLRVRSALRRFLDVSTANEAELIRAQAGDLPTEAKGLASGEGTDG